MAINSNSSLSIPETTLRRATQLACQGNWQEAAQLIQPFVLDTKQMAVVMSMLQSAPSDASAAPSLQNRISAVINVLTTPQIPQIPKSPREAPAPIITSPAKALAVPTHLCFSDTPACGLANTYPCRFEFGGTHYPSAWVCFFAQQYTDQPELMELILQCESQEQILEFASLNPMTETRKSLWNNPEAKHVNQHDVMMHVLRAKFGQNRELKAQLLATGSNLLVCQGYDSHWNDCFNMTGKSQLGKCLMQLREEYGEANAVKFDSYIQSVEEMANSCHLLLPQIDQDVWMNHIVTQLNLDSCTQLLFVSKHLNQVATAYLQKICPPLAHPCRLIDTGSGPLPFISKWKVFRWVNEIGPLVEGDLGCSFLVMREGLTLRKQIQQASESGITVNLNSKWILSKLGDNAVKQTYIILITNSVFIGSRNLGCDKQKELVTDLGCEMPTVHEYVALCTLTQSLSQICLYGENPPTLGRTSETALVCPVIVGSCVPASLDVCSGGAFDYEYCGAGGQRKF